MPLEGISRLFACTILLSDLDRGSDLESAIWQFVVVLVLLLGTVRSEFSQGGRTRQAFGGGKNGHETFRQARIYNFRDKCVVFARNLKFSNVTQ